jgi:ring-1,2-phenylacetyl-CoA epoxidase subunit PaaC
VNAQALSPRVETLLAFADDELIVGWRDSEWTGIAPTLEEDVAFSSIAQNEIGHARALYELAAADLGTDADALAFDRAPAEYRCTPLVELRLLDDWAMTIGRRYLYEIADEIRIRELMGSDDVELGSLAAKIDREEVYHRMHAELWASRLRTNHKFLKALETLAPFAFGMLEPEHHDELAQRTGIDRKAAAFVSERARGAHTPELAELLSEMTEVRRSEPGAEW